MRVPKDKQLRDIKFEHATEKRRLGQALNLKEFAILAGVSYSIAREWAQLPSFPRFQGFIFWGDFEHWRGEQYQKKKATPGSSHDGFAQTDNGFAQLPRAGLPARAAQILLDSAKSSPKQQPIGIPKQ